MSGLMGRLVKVSNNNNEEGWVGEVVSQPQIIIDDGWYVIVLNSVGELLQEEINNLTVI